MASDRHRLDTAIRHDEDGHFVELVVDVPTALQSALASVDGASDPVISLRLRLSVDEALDLASSLLAHTAAARRLARDDERANGS